MKETTNKENNTEQDAKIANMADVTQSSQGEFSFKNESNQIELVSQIFLQFKCTIGSMNDQIKIAKQHGVELSPVIKNGELLFNISPLRTPRAVNTRNRKKC